MNRRTPHYIITPTDVFHAWNFPEIDTEIGLIRGQIKDLQNAERHSVVISFLKDHKIRMDLAQSQTILVNILLSTPCRYIESLFESSKGNEHFRAELEHYLVNRLST